MNTQELQLVTFEQAKRLKAAGFDWETCHFYHCLGNKMVETSAYSANWNETKDFISAPAVALALEWCRSVKRIPCAVRLWADLQYSYEYFYDGKWYSSGHLEYSNYPAAESALLDQLLTLIEEEEL